MSDQFRGIRRQVFVTQEFYDATSKNYLHLDTSIKDELKTSATAELMSLHHDSLADLNFQHFSLKYTAGYPIDQLRSELTGVIEAFERYQKALEAYEGTAQIAPLSFAEIDDYERALQLISLCYLLHRRDLLPRLRTLLDPGYAGEDTIYEDLMAFDEEGRADVDYWHHEEPYTELVNAMYLEQPDANAALKTYCDTWYKCFEHVPWHDSHTRIEGTEGDYFGYWAFEAAAVALLYELDDSAIDHMVYPKHVVVWAREHQALSQEDAHGNALLRCEAGQPCPQTGYWFTPAQTDSKRRFSQGDPMPSLGRDYGVTIWQWREDQGKS